MLQHMSLQKNPILIFGADKTINQRVSGKAQIHLEDNTKFHGGFDSDATEIQMKTRCRIPCIS